MTFVEVVCQTKIINKNLKTIFEIENWLWKIKIHKFEVAGVMYVNSQNKAIFLKSIIFFDKIKLILYPQVRNYMTQLTLYYLPGGAFWWKF